jgi:N-acetyl-anhydromuramyl-L-alanine amidase AmpD
VKEAPTFLIIHDTDVSRLEHPEQLSIVNDSHARRGYDLSAYGYNVCYNYLIGTTGEIVHTRPNTDRTRCTRNDELNMNAIQIVLAGAFERYDNEGKDISDIPSREQVTALMTLVSELQKQYKIRNENIIGHKEASSTTCPGKNIMKLLFHFRKLHGLQETQDHRS